MKTQNVLLSLLSLIFVLSATAQTLNTPVSASINPEEFYVTGNQDEISTIITWNDASHVTLVIAEVWGFPIELEEGSDYVIEDIDGLTARFLILDDEKSLIGKTTTSDEGVVIIIHYDLGEPSYFSVYFDGVVMYEISFSVTDVDGNSIDDAILTFDGFSYAPGDYSPGVYMAGTYEYSISRQGFQTYEAILELEQPTHEVITLHPESVTGKRKLMMSAPSIYPNPASNYIIVDVDGSQASTLEIFSLSGKQLQKYSVAGPSAQLDISELEKGFYFLALSTSGQTQVIKFVKK